MGLFDFAADFGKKLFGKDEDPSEEIKAHIESDNPGVRNLGVAYDDGKVDFISIALTLIINLFRR